ncbi:Uncharacterised protein [Zhongshania aliphaticivorans]|uniref:Uncharacterized protein n=1 Tax=Zhongshania aliphaticivorans TaxID=1470434 RepID=A0A5S9MS38_9GAMM|nr:hypothetical protein [Zhongshania aliphaticivorans]CAA0080001.1 Uncharacterised protein [Zhongshania aliphaticivorans]CAA0085894.1 Uncharacterised protein [Zhongshania aliphaticivorans]
MRTIEMLGVFVMNAEIIKNKLKSSSLCEAGKAYELLASGSELVVDESVIDVASSGILETYRIRGKHISDRSGEHAQRLAKSTKELVDAIEFRDPKQLKTARIKSPGLGYFLIWFEPVSSELMGCCYLIKNNEVTEQAWSQMWDNT